jgi:hypothetical protein
MPAACGTLLAAASGTAVAAVYAQVLESGRARVFTARDCF